jgi:hypothetical protein
VLILQSGAVGDQESWAISYVVPIRRWTLCRGPDPLTEYLRWLHARVEVIVVDGSAVDFFDEHRKDWGRFVTHVGVDADLLTRNGKVGGVMTGARIAANETMIIADDDVRYDDQMLRQAAQALVGWDLVRPQNYFDPLPWHARWDTARSLINRAFGGDYSGTFILRRSTFLAGGGYSGDILFENLELLRTMRASGARIANRPDLFIRRLPPTFRDFLQQRVRHAYESFAQPKRMAVELALLPTLAGLSYARRWRLLAKLAGASIGLAEFGRRRDKGHRVFPPTSVLFAPAWSVERAVCAWVAVWLRRRGGIRYAGSTFR